MARKVTTEDFIERARQKHGDRYDYSLVDYVNAHTKVTIICKSHGKFSQAPTHHQNGKGCPDCGGKKKSNTDDFIRKAKQVHGDLYDYSSTDYVICKNDVTIICKDHGPFSQTPNNHLIGNGCPECGRIRTMLARRLNTEEFVAKARNVHGNHYDYSLVDYLSATTKIKIICEDHGVFTQTPDHHLSGNGCPACARIRTILGRRSNTEEFVAKARKIHGDLYNYSLIDYISAISKIPIICKDHGEFSQRPADHLSGNGCPDCADYGYSKAKPGTLYYVRFDLPDMTLWKIGVTNRTVKDRFAKFSVQPTILRQWLWEDGSIAAREEKRILRDGVYDQYRYTGEPLLESGNTECFTIDIMQLGNTTRVEASAA